MSGKQPLLICEALPGLTQLNALIKTIMRQTGASNPQEAIRLVNSGQWGLSMIKDLWQKVSGVTHLSVISDGTTGSQWISRLKEQGKAVSDTAVRFLLSDEFHPTSGVVTRVVIQPGSRDEKGSVSTEQLEREAEWANLTAPEMEVACLMREILSQSDLQEMGFRSICVMHKSNDRGDPGLPVRDVLQLANHRDQEYLTATAVVPRMRWTSVAGLAYKF